MAFGSTLAHEQGFADDVWRERAVGASVGCDRATFIAERDNQWVGLATGLARQDADSGGSRPRIRDDVAHHSDLISLGVPR
jgi:hypothetical protein